MADKNKRIVNKVFKILPMYEEDFDTYYKYLERIIIELQGEEQTDVLKDTVVALKGLFNVKTDVTHDAVHRIIMRYTSRLSEE